MRLRCGTAEDHVPFFVTPPRGEPTSPIALVLPTYTYLAYANDTNTWRGNPAITPSDEIVRRLQAEDQIRICDFTIVIEPIDTPRPVAIPVRRRAS